MVVTQPGERNVWLMIAVLVSWLGFLTTSARLEKTRQPEVNAEMQVALPRFVQVILSGGDRFLAANVAVFRSLIVDTKNQRPERFVVQSMVQEDAAWFNPRHEDNYYLAAANLSWNGQLDAAQQILYTASENRAFDWLPPFFYAFNQYYFRNMPTDAAHWLDIAAEHSVEESNRINLKKLAARWTEKGQDRRQALKILLAMAQQARYRKLRQDIMLRADRVRHLIQLDDAIDKYAQKHQRLPDTLEVLVRSGILTELPQDPLGQGYTIDHRGKAQIKILQK